MSMPMKQKTGDYHYTESGLDNVWLVNGVNYVDGPHGTQVIIEDIDGLHRAIGETLITHRKNLSGKEIKFLRQEMLTSQATLARLLGVSERAVIRWEGGKAGEVPGPAEATIRMLYRDFLDEEGGRGTGTMRKMLKRIADMEKEIQRVALRKPGKANWIPDFSDDPEDRQLHLSAM
jgi:putative transcriptional regulator